jgi:hypothetical protein
LQKAVTYSPLVGIHDLSGGGATGCGHSSTQVCSSPGDAGTLKQQGAGRLDAYANDSLLMGFPGTEARE